ncbi:MAG: flagellar basal body-associated FliL family protein [Desulfobulbia bacterium]
MSDDQLVEPSATEDEKELEEEAVDSENDGKKKKSVLIPKKLLLLILPLLVLAGGGVFAASYLGILNGEDGGDSVISAPAVYYDLPDMVVNLSSNDRRAQYLKIKVSLEAKEQKALAALDPVLPRIMDMFQTYLRELRTSDLDGSAGIFKLKEELLRRVNIAIYPSQVERVLFKEIVVQ